MRLFRDERKPLNTASGPLQLQASGRSDVLFASDRSKSRSSLGCIPANPEKRAISFSLLISLLVTASKTMTFFKKLAMNSLALLPKHLVAEGQLLARKAAPMAGYSFPLGIVVGWMVWPAAGDGIKQSMGLQADPSAVPAVVRAFISFHSRWMKSLDDQVQRCLIFVLLTSVYGSYMQLGLFNRAMFYVQLHI